MPKRDIRIGDVVLRRQPPVIGVWCKPPSSTAGDGCVHPSAACSGDLETCQLCEWRFCQAHFPRHQRRFECPVDVWRVFNRRRRLWYARVQANPKAKPKIDVHFPEEAPDG